MTWQIPLGCSEVLFDYGDALVMGLGQQVEGVVSAGLQCREAVLAHVWSEHNGWGAERYRADTSHLF